MNEPQAGNHQSHSVIPLNGQKFSGRTSVVVRERNTLTVYAKLLHAVPVHGRS